MKTQIFLSYMADTLCDAGTIVMCGLVYVHYHCSH